ncbi:flagellar M-ring protein FliF [Rhodothalassium salexigens DSM 2132]|uniref:Flagellar M-ring protein n=1 Tax=Rhodothalassium salexigens DSM 2132 TaxID=1188247 RepID=A0A4R2PK99_RHOSA|nr:flagellar basal-body MS-ring/collar protein FliF [Rhodothalassium salexigens]MBB4211633.1 flagellar M-ring protein FliF [Rhodothalassium salexigens DSM 2132]MBK1639097.1 flagellar M-ring protein FliF [Rhodothalassium salexigens DSM 2132]TCP34435.1 flagellar M-ring protein FliF [Rhodothalassium salexigens DSM 2132]
MERLSDLLAQIGIGRLVTGIATVIAVFTGIFLFATQFSETPMGLLYTDLELSQSQQIVQELDAQGVNYELRNGGTTVMVPRDRVDNLRVALAGQGLAGPMGYEIIDESQGLGTTSFVQNINRLRALEGEITRTLMAMNQVAGARVHIVLPERELFSRDEQTASASVVLKTRGALERPQVRAIQNIIAGAVPQLKPTRISIVDQNGELLAEGEPQDPTTMMMGSMEERRLAMETQLRRKIEQQLERVVGRDRVRAEVAIDLDMTRTTQAERIVDPNTQVARSSSITEETTNSNEPLESVSVAENLPENEGNGASASITESSERLVETSNFEFSTTERTRVREPGEVDRITASVLVDGKRGTDAEGNATYSDRTAEELQALERLVQSAIGYNPERGDTVDVVNMEFAQPERVAPELPTDTIMGFAQRNLVPLIQTVLIAVVFFVIFFTIVLPLVRKLIESWPAQGDEAMATGGALEAAPGAPRLAAPAAGAGLSSAELAARAASGDEEALAAFQQAQGGGETLPSTETRGIESQIDVAQIEGRVQESALKKVGDIVQNHPEESAAIVRNWIYGE